jgi:hypothetical protein
MDQKTTLAEALSLYPTYSVRVWVAGTYFKIDRSEFSKTMKTRTGKMTVWIDHDCNEIDLGAIFEPED